jgi:signal transduction histidine kinase
LLLFFKKEVLHYLLTHFFGKTATTGVTGLGLPIVRAIARGAGGEARRVESDRGAAFRITLPATWEAADRS